MVLAAMSHSSEGDAAGLSSARRQGFMVLAAMSHGGEGDGAGSVLHDRRDSWSWLQ